MSNPISSNCRLDAADSHDKRQMLMLYADRAAQRWVVRDSEGDFWELPLIDNAWEHRQPYELTDDAELQPVPGLYKYLIGLPS